MAGSTLVPYVTAFAWYVSRQPKYRAMQKDAATVQTTRRGDGQEPLVEERCGILNNKISKFFSSIYLSAVMRLLGTVTVGKAVMKGGVYKVKTQRHIV